jgi:uncharacterized protein (DUF58 family)
MERDQTLDLIRELRQKLDYCTLEVRWPSNEMLSSAVDRRSNRKGQGDEYDSLRAYEPGDDTKYINWQATAAESDGSFILNTHLEPRVIRFSVLLDVNSSMNFGTKGTLKSRLAALCAACGIQSAAKMKDRVSFVTYSHEPVTIRKNQAGVRAMTEFLIHALEDGSVPAEHEKQEGGGLAKAMLSMQSKNKGLLLLVSDFVNMSEEDWEALRVSGWRNDTIAVFVQDQRERELPNVPWPGASYSFEDYRGQTKTIWVTPDNPPKFLGGLTGAVSALAAKFGGTVSSRKEYTENFKRHEMAILDRLHSYGIKTVVASTEADMDAVRDVLRVLANKR